MIIKFKIIYFGVYFWKYVYDPLWYTIRVGSYIDSMVDTFVEYFGVRARATIVRVEGTLLPRVTGLSNEILGGLCP